VAPTWATCATYACGNVPCRFGGITCSRGVDVLKAELAQAQATVARDRALRSQPELNLSYTGIISPVDGVIGNRTLRVGQYVQLRDCSWTSFSTGPDTRLLSCDCHKIAR
jgi:hypothetical protein